MRRYFFASTRIGALMLRLVAPARTARPVKISSSPLEATSLSAACSDNIGRSRRGVFTYPHVLRDQAGTAFPARVQHNKGVSYALR